jgi:hypothetical protein
MDLIWSFMCILVILIVYTPSFQFILSHLNGFCEILAVRMSETKRKSGLSQKDNPVYAPSE